MEILNVAIPKYVKIGCANGCAKYKTVAGGAILNPPF
jgi:hypothetical protein